jgi:IclR family transcriptional regulator, acetate operon repressor
MARVSNASEGLGPSKALSPVRAARRVVELLNVLSDAPDGLTLRELVERAGMPKATTLRYLLTLEEHRYVERDAATGRYLLGLAIPSPAQFYARLTRAARPSLERLSAEFEENILFAMLDNGRVAFLDTVESKHVLRVASNPRDHNPVHTTALGKAIAATLPDEAIRHLLEWRGMPRLTERTLADVDSFLDEIARVRQRGYAVADRENDPDARSVAVAVPTPRVQTAVGITAPAIRFSLSEAPRVARDLQREVGGIVDALSAERITPLPADA